MCISINTAINKPIQRIQIRVSKNDKFENVIIIRIHSVNTKTQIMHHETQKNEKIEKIVQNSILKMSKFAKFKFALIIHKID